MRRPLKTEKHKIVRLLLVREAAAKECSWKSNHTRSRERDSSEIADREVGRGAGKGAGREVAREAGCGDKARTGEVEEEEAVAGMEFLQHSCLGRLVRQRVRSCHRVGPHMCVCVRA